MAKAKRPTLMMTKTQAELFTAVELEIMRRRMENEPPERIQVNMGLTSAQYIAITQHPRWNEEYEIQTRSQDRGIRPRMDRLGSEALDVVTSIMRTASSPAYQLRAALEILDRTGHVKVEKRLNINADAEAIIRHLNQLGVEPAKLEAPAEGFTEAELVDATQSIENAAREVRRSMKEKS